MQGQFGAASTAGKLASAHEFAWAIWHEAENIGRVWEASAANSMLGLIAFWRGDFVAARSRCERTLDARDSPLNRHVWERFGDGSPLALFFLAATTWQFGEVERAR